MLKRLMSLLLVLCLLPVLSLAEEEDDLSIEEITEEVMLDDDGNEILVDEETGESFILSSVQQDELEALDETVDTSVDPDTLELNLNLPDHIINILLLGTDGRDTRYKTLRESQEADGEGDSKGIRQRADVWIILSLNTQDGTVKLSSLMRDTYLSVPGYTNKNKITNLFDYKNKEGNYGANAELCMRTLNHHFDLNIQNYVTINFYGLASIIDAMGGADVDLTKAEAKAINAYLKKHASQMARTYDSREAQANRVSLEARDGFQHLDGVQAVMYARLRSNLGGDQKRTERQRHLLDLLLQQLVSGMSSGTVDAFEIINTSLDYVTTNINAGTMFNLVRENFPAIKARLGTSDTLIEQFRIPMDKTYGYSDVETSTGSKMSVVFMSADNLQKNKEALHEFIYGSYIPAE